MYNRILMSYINKWSQMNYIPKMDLSKIIGIFKMIIKVSNKTAHFLNCRMMRIKDKKNQNGEKKGKSLFRQLELENR